MKYKVTWVEYHGATVDAENEEEAQEKRHDSDLLDSYVETDNIQVEID